MMRLTRIPQTVRNLNRFREILQIIAKHGFGDVIGRMGLHSALHTITNKVRKRPVPEVRKPTEVRIRETIEELGPTFTKLGQILATRPDLIPMTLVKELRLLQDDVPADSTDKIKELLVEEFGKPVNEVFADFGEEALAAASIAQVHTATLLNGQEVVLKIQRPGLQRVIETDLAIMRFVAEFVVETMPEAQQYNPIGIVDEFERSLLKEIDFTREASYMQRFARNFADNPTVYVPKVYDDWTTSRVLCEELIKGVKVSDPELLSKPVEVRERVAIAGIESILEQVFTFGFFHADPHPGNIFVIDFEKICFIDYGMMGLLDQARIDDILSFLVSILTNDPDGLVRLLTRLELIGESVNERALRVDVMDMLDRYASLELSKMDIGKIITDVFEVITRHHIVVPSDLLLVGKALATIDGVARALYPELEPIKVLRPLILKVYLQRLTDPKAVTRIPRQLLDQSLHLLLTAPRDLRLLLGKLRKGEFVTNTRFADLGHMLHAYERAQNRLFLALVVGALIIASATLINDSNLEIPLFGMPLDAAIGLLFLGLAVFYGAFLVVGFFRSGGV